MSTKIETRPTSVPHTIVHYASATVHDLPYELLLSIFHLLGIKGCLSSRLTCHRWKMLVGEPTTIYGKYIQEVNAITKLPLLEPKCSAWEAMPRHWDGLVVKELKFSSVSTGIITFRPTFHPPFFHQSSKFFPSAHPRHCLIALSFWLNVAAPIF